MTENQFPCRENDQIFENSGQFEFALANILRTLFQFSRTIPSSATLERSLVGLEEFPKFLSIWTDLNGNILRTVSVILRILFQFLRALLVLFIYRNRIRVAQS